jgi:Holliday junction DNA helicase RuvA
MIAYLKGRFTYKSPGIVHIEVQGVGYEVQISLNTYSEIESIDEGFLHTHLLIREDAHILYGFFDTAEKNMFLQLIGISGVGASTARMMLSAMKPEEISRAIVQGNAKQLESIKGIGKKSAERIILELRDKVGKGFQEAGLEVNNSAVINNSYEQDALNALISLGIARPAAEQAVRKVLAAETNPGKIEDIIKQALKTL